MKIENLVKCTGCGACYSICPKSAISMTLNTEGFLYPNIDKSKCVECGVCETHCHSINPLVKRNEEPKSFAAINQKENIRLESSSGGIFTAIAEKVIDRDGIVFGAKFDKNLTVVHGWTDTRDGLAEFRGAKYVQSFIGDSFKECKNFLEQGKQVLFSGTPCQIAGLRRFIGKEYDNLLTIDIVCHGVPSQKIWQKYREELSKTNKSCLMAFSFRRKNKGWLNYQLESSFENGSVCSIEHDRDLFMNLYLSNNCLRESCYLCKYKDKYYYSDITLGDFWGINKLYPDMFDNKGTSLLLIHSAKGETIVSQLTDCEIREMPLRDCVKYNPSVIKEAQQGKMRNHFFSDVENLSIKELVKNYGKKKDFSYYVKVLKKEVKRWLIK